MSHPLTLTVPDYAVAIVLVVIPLTFGVYYAWKDSDNVNREEYLLGGRQMGMVPVALSLFVTFQSAIALMGMPSETYLHGTMNIYINIGIALASALGSYTMVPLMYPLRLTSIYDYLGLRYRSRAVRLLGTGFGILMTFFYLVIALFAPGLALQAVTGIPFWVSVVAVGGIGTVCTAIGGIKSVIWSEVFQTVIMFIGLFVIVIRGIIIVGGVEKAWGIAEDGGRIHFTDINPDPRTRHTIWGGVIGSGFSWLGNVFNQATLQRVSSMKSMRMAKQAYLLNAVLNFVFAGLLIFIGILIYSYFYVIRCDPMEAGAVSNPNQLLLVYVLETLQEFPGLAGLFMAAIFSGSLSTLASGINALTTNTVEDILRGDLRGLSEKTITVLAKILVFIYGFIIIGCAHLAKSLKGPITQMSTSVLGIFGSGLLSMFLVGCTVPWANKYGALTGGVVSLVFNLWMVTGSLLCGKTPQTLPHAPTDACSGFLTNGSWTNTWGSETNRPTHYSSPVINEVNITSTLFISDINISTTSVSPVFNTIIHLPTLALDGNISSFASLKVNLNSSSLTPGVTNISSMSEVYLRPCDSDFFLYNVSYLWYGLVGDLVGCFTILLVSWLTGGRQQFYKAKTTTDPSLILPMLRRFWSLEEIPKASGS